MNHSGVRRGLLTACLCAAAGLTAISPVISALPSHAPRALASAACALPAPVTISVDANATPVLAASPVSATPTAQNGAAVIGEASPVAETGATADGEPLNDAATVEIEQLIATVAACQTAGDYATLSQLVTPHFLKQVYGGGVDLTAAQFIELGKDLSPQTVGVRSTSDFRVDAQGMVSADVVTIAGKQLVHGRWSFIPAFPTTGDSTGGQSNGASGAWQVDGVTPLAADVPAGAQEIAVSINDNAMTPATMSAKRGGDLVLTGTNTGKSDHELLVLRLPGAMTAADLLLATGPSLPKGVVFIGQITIQAGGTGQVVLTNMPRGSYVVVDMLPDPDGVPYLSKGLVAQLTVS